MNSPRKKVLLLITDAGGGHRASANALKAAAEAAGLPWDLRIVNLYRDIWQDVEPMRRYFGFYAEDLYNFVLKNSLSKWTPLMRQCAHFSAGQPNVGARNALREFLAAEKPDLCVSLMPFVNDLLMDCHRELDIPLGLVCTDLMDTEPYMWFTRGICRQAAFVSAATVQAAAQAAERNPPRLLNPGLLIHPQYFNPAVQNLPMVSARASLDLDKDLFTVLILMGGFGGRSILQYVRRLERSRNRLQVLAVCGRNERLRARLGDMAPGLKNKVVAYGFTKKIPSLLRASDLLLTKPGPASIFEALAMNTPLLLDEVDVMPQELPNAAWVEKHGLGRGLKSRRDVLAAVEAFARDPALGEGIRMAQRARAPRDASGPILQAMIESLAFGNKTPAGIR
jgi:UDP-N-acetylglucosamine:LPS N-acetylglucosamine transferase